VANPDPTRPITRRCEWLFEPDRWLAEKEQDVRQIRRFGDALPAVRVDFGPGLVASLIGVDRQFASDTGWLPRVICNPEWADAPDWRVKDNRWWRQYLLLLDMAAEHGAGRYLVCSPNLGAGPDILAKLRGGTELCMDLLDRPETVAAAIDALYPAWHEAFVAFYERALVAGALPIHWLMLWSERPYMVSECDLGYMIGQREFRRLCLPEIARQVAAVGRACFHLDGSGATRHLDTLLEIPQIRAIQYTPGAGTPSAMPWLGMFRRIMATGRAVMISAPVGEVLPLMEALPPEGLAIQVEGPATVDELEEIESAVNRRYGRSIA
jgi:hypothetical protein